MSDYKVPRRLNYTLVSLFCVMKNHFEWLQSYAVLSQNQNTLMSDSKKDSLIFSKEGTHVCHENKSHGLIESVSSSGRVLCEGFSRKKSWGSLLAHYFTPTTHEI